MSRRVTAIVIFVAWLVLSSAYAAFAPVLGYHIEWAGVTMLGALAAAMGIMVFVLYAGPGD